MEAPKRRKTVAAVEGTIENVIHGSKEKKPQRSIEETYQKKSQLEHILLRPDSYVGSVERQSQDHWIFDDQAGLMTKRKLEYVPALYKIFDEILVNAADNLVRDPTQDTIRIDIRKKEGTISVFNNGRGLPVQMHKEHKCYVPELVFGQLLTSDNYDDSEKKVTGGRNGYGAKLTNIFSSRFVVETVDSSSKKTYKQVWEKNMGVVNKPEITTMAQGSEDFTQVTFKPDFSRFSMNKLEDDIVDLMARRAYDVAASTHGRCKVFLNGKQLSVASFEDYVSLYLGQDAFKVCETVNDRWEVAVGITDGSGFQQVSFVNSISTSRGGTHVDYVANQLVGAVLDRVNKQKGGGLAVKAQHVRGYLWVFVNCLIENPAFDSQTKETLTVKREKFGSTCELPNDMVTAVLESGILDALQEWSKAMGKSELAQHLNRSDLGMQKRIFGIPKLEDANKAGTKESGECTLILTEGDSAKALAVAGLSVVGRDHYGVFPLRGKLRNVRELSVKQLMENKEIDQVMRIMALDASKEYLDRKGLRYGSIMIMTDQDYDGSHIKGLIINFIQQWFPTLMKVPGFLKEFVTPIVKVNKGDVTHTFFTLPEYSKWKQENNDGQGWKVKYYKGLGTSTSQEAKDYFGDMQDHQIFFTHDGSMEADDLVDMAFNPKRADDRKVWISQVDENTYVDHTEAELSYSDFINKELSLFAKYDVERAIPSVVDGFKPGQRKVMFGCFKKKCKDDIKVAQLSGYVAEHSAYHHGEGSLQGTIIGMSQTFVGANNVNLLMPVGQFGTRLQGGKDHAAARYIFTKLSKAARCVFPEADDPVLEYMTEEGMSIEPKWYCPIIPMVLVNGAEGIGTGWSTTVPNYSPREVIARVRAAMRGEELEPLVPWYRGFKGSITPVEGTKGKFEVTGVATRRGSTRVEITELPVKKWTQDYKDWLLEHLPTSGSEQRAAFITEVREHHTENSVHFVVSMTPDKLADAEGGRGLERAFHLRGSLSNTNMWLFDQDGRIKKYDTPEAVIHDFMPVRLKVYEKRKDDMMEKMERELSVISNKYKFVQLVVTDQLDVENRKSTLLCSAMRKHGLQWMCEIEARGKPVSRLTPAEEMGPLGFKYLVSMKMWSLTDERLEELRRQREAKTALLEELRKTSLEVLWERDLQKLEEALDACDREDAKEAEAAAKLAMKKVDETFLENNQCVIALSRNLTAKRLRASEWRARKKGGKLAGRGLLEKKVAKDAEEGGEEEGEEDEGEEDVEKTSDALAFVFCCRDFDKLLVFTEDGLVYLLQALDVPLAKKMSAPGSALKDILPALGDKGKVTALVTIPQGRLKDQTDEFIVLVSKCGMAKKVMLDRFRALRAGKGVPAMKLAQGDKLGWAHRASTNCALVLVSAQGFAVRITMGDDWRCSTPQGPGRPAMRMRPGSGDYIAGSSLSQITEAEVQRAADEKEAAEKRRQAIMAAAALLAKEGPQSETAVAAVAAATGKSARPPITCDDDDSDNGAPDTTAAPAASASTVVPAPTATPAAAELQGAGKGDAGSEDGDSDAGNKDGEDDEENENEAAGEAPEGTGAEDICNGVCALIVTAHGMASRIPLSNKRFKLVKRGRRGMRVMRLAANDSVVGVVVVSATTEEDAKVRSAFMRFFDERRAEIPEAGFAKIWAAKAKWAEMAPEEKQVYIDRRNEELQELQKHKEDVPDRTTEEILLSSQAGFVNRLRINGIVTLHNCSKGRSIARTKQGDRITSVSLLSSQDADPEQEAEASSKPLLAKPPAPAVKRTRPKEVPPQESETQPCTSSAPAAAMAAPPGTPRDATDSQGSRPTPPRPTPAMSPFGFRPAAESTGGQARQSTEPRRLSTGSNKRLRGKQSSTLPSPMVALRRRVSHMASPLFAHSRSFSKDALSVRRNGLLRRKSSSRLPRQLSWDVGRHEAGADEAMRDGGAAPSPPVPLQRVTWDVQEMARAAKAGRK